MGVSGSAQRDHPTSDLSDPPSRCLRARARRRAMPRGPLCGRAPGNEFASRCQIRPRRPAEPSPAALRQLPRLRGGGARCCGALSDGGGASASRSVRRGDFARRPKTTEATAIRCRQRDRGRRRDMHARTPGAAPASLRIAPAEEIDASGGACGARVGPGTCPTRRSRFRSACRRGLIGICSAR